MKYLIMCEGPNELEIIKILLRHNCLKFTDDNLLGLIPYHARQIKSSFNLTQKQKEMTLDCILKHNQGSLLFTLDI